MSTPAVERAPHATPTDTAEDESLRLALMLQAEEEQDHLMSGADVGAMQAMPAAAENDPDLEASLALAMELQRQDDDAQLRAALGIVVNDHEAAGDAEPGSRSLSPSQLDYEHLMRLRDNVGVVLRGASSESLAELPVLSHAECVAPGSDVLVGDVCSICRCAFEDEDELRVLACKHADHKDCIDQWLKMSKACPLCHHEVKDPSSQ